MVWAPSFSSVDGICWTPHYGSGRPAWITQQAAVAPLRRAQKAGGKCSAIKSRQAEEHRADSVYSTKSVFATFWFIFPKQYWKTNKRSHSVARQKWICKPLSKASVCINTKPSLSRRANASLLAHWFQWNYVTEISKYVIYGLESCRRLLIKYAKLYLSTEVWICSGVQSSNHTKGGGMFPWNLPSHCNSSFPPLSNYCWLAICTLKQC